MAFAAGAAAGAAAGLMYAPAAGAETRRKLADTAAGGVRKAAGSIDLVTGAYSATGDIARRQVSRLFAAVTAGVEEARRVKEEMERISGEFGTKHE